MRATKLFALLLAISVAHFAHCETDDFDDTDDGITVEDEKVSCVVCKQTQRVVMMMIVKFH